ncbi:MAG: preprotein translocase subunit SecG [Clostridia bacterium]
MNMFTLLSVSLIPSEVWTWLRPLLQILMALVGIATIVIVLMQKSADNNIGAIGGQQSSDTYAGKNKAKSKENKLKIWTIVGGAVMLLLSILYFITFLEIK